MSIDSVALPTAPAASSLSQSGPARTPPLLRTSEFESAGPGSDSLTRDDTLRETFQDFVGQTLFGSMLASMRKTVGKPAYLHGGRGEEVFQQQLDQHLVEDLTDASAASISEPMYELFNLQRRAG